MALGDIHNCIPPRPSKQYIGVLLGVGIEPMEVLVRVADAASSMAMVSDSFYPFVTEIGWLVFVLTVGILMTMIESMLGTIMDDLKPTMAIAVLLHNPF